MPVITISRQIGSYGDEISRQVAEKLNCNLVEKKELHQFISEYKGDFSKELTVLSNESRPGFFDRLFYHRSVYGSLVASLIYKYASQGNVVIMGRGGQFLLNRSKHVLNVSIIAPLAERIERVQRKEGIEKDIAEGLVEKTDSERNEFIRYLYQGELTNPELYDLIISTGKISQEEVVDTICTMARRLEEKYPLSDNEKQTWKNLSLEKTIEVKLQKEMYDSNYLQVKVPDDGKAVVSGFLSTDAEKNEAERIIKTVDGVKEITNRIIVSQYPVRPWE
jgi:cytidylate kinase